MHRKDLFNNRYNFEYEKMQRREYEFLRLLESTAAGKTVHVKDSYRNHCTTDVT